VLITVGPEINFVSGSRKDEKAPPTTSLSMASTPVDIRLSEEFVQDCFHSYLKSSLTQAKAERLVDAELLGSAEADLMITGQQFCVCGSVAVLGELILSSRSCTLLVLCSPKMYDQPALRAPSKAEGQSQSSRYYGHRPVRGQLSSQLPLILPRLGR